MNSPDIQSADQVTPTGPLPPQLLNYYASTDESAVHIVWRRSSRAVRPC
jgi:hypothetical protein